MGKVNVNNVKIKPKKIKQNKKKNLKLAVTKTVAETTLQLPPSRKSDEPITKNTKWINRQRVLVFAARGINHRHRHLMEDIKRLMPHHKPESKMERSKNLFVVNEMCEMKNCNKCLLFEGRKKQDLYLWASNIPKGPSAKFLIQNVYTMQELKMTGNCLRASRPLLSFDQQFSTVPHLSLLKEIFTQIFGVPNQHPKSQPFFDHVYTFTVLDDRIWFRNYQILSEDGALAEIGPRFVLNPVKIFSGSFGGDTLWENQHYVSPAKYRQALSKKASNKYQNRIEQKAIHEATRPDTAYPEIDGNNIFRVDPVEGAKQEVQEENYESEDNDNPEDQDNSVSQDINAVAAIKYMNVNGNKARKPQQTNGKVHVIKRKQFKEKTRAKAKRLQKLKTKKKM